ncbi:hypothetical protein M0R45_029495 [Rubus argutus]|uniref:Uncharacterized protein n=1 Tax=Rubus argutus TaxID=59490 RepID=A0AAW1WAU2_RUBAR
MIVDLSSFNVNVSLSAVHSEGSLADPNCSRRCLVLDGMELGLSGAGGCWVLPGSSSQRASVGGESEEFCLCFCICRGRGAGDTLVYTGPVLARGGYP